MPDLDPPDPLLDSVIDGRYRVVERIGAGGMGTVYRAQQLTIERDVAVKFLRADAYGDPRQVRRFEREAQMIARLRDPHTLKLIDFGRRPDGQLYLVTEFLDGEPLDRRLARGALGASEAIDLLRPVCDALAEAHAEGIVHRDLKPGNLFVERVGARELVKVLDFGIARWTEGEHSTTGVSGTPAYMAPEQARGQAVDHRCDLYALGAVLYACLAGRPPYTGSGWSVMFKVMAGPPPPFDELDPPIAVPPGLSALVMRLMAPAPDDRPQSVVEVAAELDRLRRTDGFTPTAGVTLSASVTAETLDVDSVEALAVDSTEAMPAPPLSPVLPPTALAPSAPDLAPPTLDAPRGEAQARSTGGPRSRLIAAALALAGVGVGVWVALGGDAGEVVERRGAVAVSAGAALDAMVADVNAMDATPDAMGAMPDAMPGAMPDAMPDMRPDAAPPPRRPRALRRQPRPPVVAPAPPPAPPPEPTRPPPSTPSGFIRVE